MNPDAPKHLRAQYLQLLPGYLEKLSAVFGRTIEERDLCVSPLSLNRSGDAVPLPRRYVPQVPLSAVDRVGGIVMAYLDGLVAASGGGVYVSLSESRICGVVVVERPSEIRNLLTSDVLDAGSITVRSTQSVALFCVDRLEGGDAAAGVEALEIVVSGDPWSLPEAPSIAGSSGRTFVLHDSCEAAPGANQVVEAPLGRVDDRREYLRCRRFSSSRSQLCVIPFHLENLGLGDVIEFGEGSRFVGLVERSCNAVMEVTFRSGYPDRVAVAARLSRAGRHIEWTPEQRLLVDVPDEEALAIVVEDLRSQRATPSPDLHWRLRRDLA